MAASWRAPTSFRRLYRAFVQPRHLPDIELTAFVEASSRQSAIHRIAAAIAALEYGSTAESVSERIYNCASAAECIDEGVSEDPDLRIFETGWGGGRPICFVEHPLFLVPDPAPLCRKWALIPQFTNEYTDVVTMGSSQHKPNSTRPRRPRSVKQPSPAAIYAHTLARIGRELHCSVKILEITQSYVIVCRVALSAQNAEQDADAAILLQHGVGERLFTLIRQIETLASRCEDRPTGDSAGASS